MDVSALRAQSSKMLAKLGLPPPVTLPLLDEQLRLRSKDDVLDRLLCLHAVAACAYGFNRQAALNWLYSEKLEGKLTKAEADFLTRGYGNPDIFKVQIEGMWTLAWALGLVEQIDFMKDCDSKFARLMPNLRSGQSSDELRRKSRLKTTEEIAAHCDLAYSLHWAVRQAILDKKEAPIAVQLYVIVERRRALEWLLSDEDWDDVPLDT